MIQALSYIVVETPHLDAWATQVWNLMVQKAVIVAYWL